MDRFRAHSQRYNWATYKIMRLIQTKQKFSLHLVLLSSSSSIINIFYSHFLIVVNSSILRIHFIRLLPFAPKQRNENERKIIIILVGDLQRSQACVRACVCLNFLFQAYIMSMLFLASWFHSLFYLILSLTPLKRIHSNEALKCHGRTVSVSSN